ncbi:MAG: hypothetical protein IKK63_08840 [Clostridia bacterium]|nr:hypothetical protein [Clostridia bacterium]
MKKIIAIITAFLMLFAFASCGENKDKEENKTEIVTDIAGEAVTDEAGETVTKLVEESETEKTTVAESTTVPETTLPPVSLSSDNPAEWTTEEIVEFYKTAAINSKSQKSVEKKNLSEMVVKDGDGWLKTLVEWVTPILVFALEKSESEFDGITGGYENLVPEDVQSAKAYKSGNYIVVEMKMKEQTDGPHGDRYSGSVGHAISVLGDISAVSEALGDKLVIDFDNAKLTLRYVNPTVKVKINDKGIIEKGTWSYTIDVQVANLYVAAVRLPFSATVESAYGSVDYTVEVGGGF